MDEDRKNSKIPQKIPDVCYFWKQNRCAFGAQCRNLHEELPPAAGDAGSSQAVQAPNVVPRNVIGAANNQNQRAANASNVVAQDSNLTGTYPNLLGGTRMWQPLSPAYVRDKGIALGNPQWSAVQRPPGVRPQGRDDGGASSNRLDNSEPPETVKNIVHGNVGVSNEIQKLFQEKMGQLKQAENKNMNEQQGNSEGIVKQEDKKKLTRSENPEEVKQQESEDAQEVKQQQGRNELKGSENPEEVKQREDDHEEDDNNESDMITKA